MKSADLEIEPTGFHPKMQTEEAINPHPDGARVHFQPLFTFLPVAKKQNEMRYHRQTLHDRFSINFTHSDYSNFPGF